MYKHFKFLYRIIRNISLNIEYQILTILSHSNLKKDIPKLIISKRNVIS